MTEGAQEVVETVEQVGYVLQQADVDKLFTLISGMATVQMFTWLAQLLIIGVLLAVIFVIALRRF